MVNAGYVDRDEVLVVGEGGVEKVDVFVDAGAGYADVECVGEVG